MGDPAIIAKQHMSRELVETLGPNHVLDHLIVSERQFLPEVLLCFRILSALA